MDKNYDVITFILRRPRVANGVAMFIKTTSKDSKKVKKIRNYGSKYNLYL